MVVEVAGDPIPVLQQQHPLLIGARVGQLQGERGVVGEGGRHLQVRLVEVVATMPTADGKGAADVMAADQR